ncbi:MAG TPA: BadF/BadG/BcrA/BcrD ATPase family protein, partial [Isosphaeraceae bacterium]|nr:BadF/BadG/BcrA/BcrD ATPase family protein [Isosphaeraceae bacterium]
MNGPLILGMDGGGTDTTTWLADADGTVLGRGRSGPSNIKAVGANAARNALDLSILAAFQDAGVPVGPIEVACLGLAGFDRPRDKEWLRSWASESAWARKLVLHNDGDLVVASTPEGWGVGLIAGTGSIAVGRDREGRTSRAGGWGYIISDEGSAFSVSVAALKRVVRRADGREAVGPGGDALSRRLFEAMGITGTDQLIASVYGEGLDRARLASLAPVVVAAMEDDPQLLAEILHPAAFELAEMAAAVARNLGWRSGHLPLAMAGGFLLGCEPLAAKLREDLEGFGYQVDTTRVPEPVRGALALA